MKKLILICLLVSTSLFACNDDWGKLFSRLGTKGTVVQWGSHKIYIENFYKVKADQSKKFYWLDESFGDKCLGGEDLRLHNGSLYCLNRSLNGKIDLVAMYPLGCGIIMSAINGRTYEAPQFVLDYETNREFGGIESLSLSRKYPNHEEFAFKVELLGYHE